MPAPARAGRVALTGAVFALLLIQIVASARSAIAAFLATRGEALQLQGDHAAALHDFHAANRALPIDANRFWLEATAAREVGGPEAALPAFSNALARAPYSPLLLLAAAENSIALERDDAAAAPLARLATLMPDEWRAHYLRGQIATRGGRPVEAAEHFAAASADPGAPPDARHQWAAALHALGEDAQALALLDAVLQVRSISPESRLLRGTILLERGDAEAARKDLGWAARAFEGRIVRGSQGAAVAPLLESLDALARADFQLARFDEAREALERRVEHTAAEELAALAIMVSTWLDTDTQAAAPARFYAFALDLCASAAGPEHFDRVYALALSRHPSSAPAELAPPRARALTAAGKASEALALLASASEGAAKSAETVFATAEAQAALDRREEARRQFASLLERSDLSVALRRKTLAAIETLDRQ